MPQIVLRYFSARGRAQPLRYTLSDSGLEFTDERMEIAEWPARREDVEIGGPFAALPTLTWDGVTVAETLVIAPFLAEKLGHRAGRSERELHTHDAICSFVSMDCALRVGEVLWAEVLYPPSNAVLAAPRTIMRMMQKLGRLERLLPDEAYLGGDSPVVADYFAMDGYDALRFLVGPSRHAALDARLPKLARFHARIASRPGVMRALETRPRDMTASPAEREALARVHAADLSSTGL